MARTFNFDVFGGLENLMKLRDNKAGTISYPVKDQNIEGTNSDASYLVDNLKGGEGNDTITGLAGVNYIDGKGGNDYISTGFWGNSVDHVTGGKGNDIFEVAFEFDSYDISNRNKDGSSTSILNISDFTAGEDKLHFQNTNMTFSNLDTNGDGIFNASDSNGGLFVSQDDRGLHIGFNDGHFVNLAGVSSLTTNDVTFASTVPSFA